MSAPTLPPTIRYVNNGEAVQAGTPNRPMGDLAAQIQYLWSLIQQSSGSQALFARLQTVEPAAVVGQPVFYNSITKRFERGIVAVAPVPLGNVITLADSAQIWGLVFQKINSTLADIVLCGFVPLDISAAVGGQVTAGLYYLSGSTPGGLQDTRPAVAVPVARSDGQGNVFVLPQTTDALDRHTHYHFRLVAEPAGDTIIPAMDGVHVIDNPNPALPGWLPANHPIFNGLAPVGAKFGYNFSADTTGLAATWPPVPIGSCYLELDRALYSHEGLQGVPLGTDGMAIIDMNGIWWLSNCAGDAPWPNEDFGGGSVSESIPTPPACPRTTPFRVDVWFTRLNTAEASS